MSKPASSLGISGEVAVFARLLAAALVILGVGIAEQHLIPLIDHIRRVKDNMKYYLSWFDEISAVDLENKSLRELSELLLKLLKGLDYDPNTCSLADAIDASDRLVEKRQFKFPDSSKSDFRAVLRAYIAMYYVAQFFDKRDFMMVIGSQNSGKSGLLQCKHNMLFGRNDPRIVVGNNKHTIKITSFETTLANGKNQVWLDSAGINGGAVEELLRYIPKSNILAIVTNVQNGINQSVRKSIDIVKNTSPEKVFVFFNQTDTLLNQLKEHEDPTNRVLKAKANRIENFKKQMETEFGNSEIFKCFKDENMFLACFNNRAYAKNELEKIVEKKGNPLVMNVEQAAMLL